jgi:hypothetical protein
VFTRVLPFSLFLVNHQVSNLLFLSFIPERYSRAKMSLVYHQAAIYTRAKLRRLLLVLSSVAFYIFRPLVFFPLIQLFDYNVCLFMDTTVFACLPLARSLGMHAAARMGSPAISA